MIEVVSYDIWRTLLRANPEYVSLRGALIATHLGWHGDPTPLTQAVSTASKELDKLTDATGVQYGFLPRVEYAAKLLSLKLPDQDSLVELQQEVVAAHLLYLPRLTEPTLPDTFRRHRKEGRKVAVISNTGMTEGNTLRQILDKLELLESVDYELYSDELGFAKPDPRIFELLVQHSGVPAYNILHIGDNEIADYQGARDAGLHALHYAPNVASPVQFIQRHEDVLGHPVLHTND